MDVDESLASALTLLAYSPLWLEWGFLSETTLREQLAAYQTGQETNTEHCRYAGFRRILSSRSAITETVLEQYLDLAHRDADQAMAQAALLDLLNWRGLTVEQFDRLRHRPDFTVPPFSKITRRRRLLTELASSAVVSATTLEECLTSQDSMVQRELLTKSTLTREQWETMAERGVTRAIRNLARVHLKKGVRKGSNAKPHS